jgi:hypothetical protein
MKHWIGIFFVWGWMSGLSAQPIFMDIPKTRTFELRSAEPQFDVQIHHLEAPDAFSSKPRYARSRRRPMRSLG